MLSVLNIAGYRFTPLDALARLQESLRELARERDLRGTILLAPEGINFFLAGSEHQVRDFLRMLRAMPPFSGIEVKESFSSEVPFGKLLVKTKREIIRMDHPAIQPAEGRAPALGATTLKRWLDQGHDDEGRPVLMLDTRNAFEVEEGTFEGAAHWYLSKFSEFPGALEAHKQELEGKTVVSFCTGGIRCEKAAIYMREAGLDHVWQLDGGILKYFEETGGAHFEGQCFVFDERVALDRDLRPTEAVIPAQAKEAVIPAQAKEAVIPAQAGIQGIGRPGFPPSRE